MAAELKPAVLQKNYMQLQFPSKSENESLARVAVAALATQLDPTIEQLQELKTAVSEAVTNAIIHGYDHAEGEVRLYCAIDNGAIEVIVEDDGIGIADIEEARQPMYTTRPELERSGMGFTIMETFMDEVTIESVPGKGTRVRMVKVLAHSAECQ